MHKAIALGLAAWFAVTSLSGGAPPKSRDKARDKTRELAYKEDRAVIVVTGMRVDEDPEKFRSDLSVAEGATVKLIGLDGKSQQKETKAFSRSKRSDGAVHFTADFMVDLDATYTVEMTFRDGTVLRVADYRLPRDWKTHFYFHATTGTLSPASILRTAEDSRTRLRCCVYAVYPLESYRKLGGSQIQ